MKRITYPKDEMSLVDYLPILVGGLFDKANYYDGSHSTAFTPDRALSLIKGLGSALPPGSDLSVRWRSSDALLDASPNFEGSSFLAMFDYYAAAAVSSVTVSLSVEREIVEPRSRYVRSSGIDLSSGEVVGTEESIVLVTPRAIVEGSSIGQIIRRFEYVPSIVCNDVVDVESRTGGMLYLCLHFEFPFSDYWAASSGMYFAIPDTSKKAMDETIKSMIALVSMPTGSIAKETIRPMMQKLTERGVDRYVFDMHYKGRPEQFYTHLEEVLLVTLRGGKRKKAKEKNFFQINHVAFAWDILRPYIEEVDRTMAAKLQDSYIQGELVLGYIFLQMRTLSNVSLAEIYTSLDTRPYTYQPKIDGEQSKLFITIEEEGPEAKTRLTFFEALALGNTMQTMSLDMETILFLRENGMPTSKKLTFVIDAEAINDEFYAFRSLVIANENYLAKSEEESWRALSSPMMTALFKILYGYGIIIHVNFPTLLTKANFSDVLMFERMEIGGAKVDGLILAPPSATYLGSGNDEKMMLMKMKPQRHNSLDLLLKRVPLETFALHSIRLPPGVKDAYIAYCTGSTATTLNAPIAKLRTGVWRTRHFPWLAKYEVGPIPCEAMTSILPTSHVAIVMSEEEDSPDYDDKIAECLIVDGWVRPLFIRDNKTASYKRGVHVYGNSYRMLLSVLPSILDPITADTVAAIQRDPKKYFNPPSPDSRRYYDEFLKAVAVGKAVVYGKYLSTVLNAEAASASRRGGPVAGIVAPHTLIEIGCGHGSDLARAYCAGMRALYAVDINVHALLSLESRANYLSARYGNSQFAAQIRRNLGIQTPIVYPIQTFSIPQNPSWTLRTIVGEMSDREEKMDELTKKLVTDTSFPPTGVAAIAVHFALQAFACGDGSLLQLKKMCSACLSPHGLVSFVYYDGRMIFNMFNSPPPRPWNLVTSEGRKALEMKHTDVAVMGGRKYYIEKRWPDGAFTSATGCKVAVHLPPFASSIEEEYLIDPLRLTGAFTPQYRVVYDGPMLSDPSFVDALKESGRMSMSKELQDTFSPPDYQYLGLIRVTIFEKMASAK